LLNRRGLPDYAKIIIHLIVAYLTFQVNLSGVSITKQCRFFKQSEERVAKDGLRLKKRFLAVSLFALQKKAQVNFFL